MTPIGLAAIDGVDWSYLLHAYGRAHDTPKHLRALVSGDAVLQKAAMEHLWSAIIHQGTPWLATAPVARVVVGIVFDATTASIRSALLEFLIEVAEAPERAGFPAEELQTMAAFDIEPFLRAERDDAVYEDEEAANSQYARTLLACIAVAPLVMEVMISGLDAADAEVRAVAGMGAAKLSRSAAFADQSVIVMDRLRALAQEAPSSDERAAHVMSLGELGYVPREYLSDGSRAVRLCAALAPGLRDDPNALEELLFALEHHVGELNDWFDAKPPHFEMQPRFPVVERLAEQVEFDRLAPAALATLAVTSAYSCDYDWGILLAAAFRDGAGRIESQGQLSYLRGLVDRPELWSIGNAHRWFEQAGLPFDRDACARLVAAATVSR